MISMSPNQIKEVAKKLIHIFKGMYSAFEVS